tara:strand:- start:2724 stop:2906 length:183 start_codon:yes stop_codon:yes gene_type:complete
VKNIKKYPTLVGSLRDSIKEVISVNNAQMSILENIILNISINIKKELRSILRSIKKKEGI